MNEARNEAPTLPPSSTNDSPRAQSGTADSEYLFEAKFSGVRYSDRAASTHGSEPVSLQEAREERSSHRAADVVMTLRPVQTAMCE